MGVGKKTMDKMDELRKLAGTGLGSIYEGTIFTIECKYGFEPNGKASEDWEFYYILTLPRVCYHYKTTKGWKETTHKEICMNIKGPSLDEVIGRAIYFLKWYYLKENIDA